MGASILLFFADRFKEPSTWRGIIAVATSFGMYLSPNQQEAILMLGLALSGGTGIVTKDK